jgi:hypothetical protein
VFIGWITLLVQLPVQLFFTLWAGAFLGGVSTSFGLFEHGSQVPFIFFGTLAFFGVPIVAYWGKKLNYSRTEYRFLADRWPPAPALVPIRSWLSALATSRPAA